SLLVDGKTENTYKLGLRAALLTAGSIAEKLVVRGMVEALYEIRSNLIHAGVAPVEVKVKGEGRVPTHEVVQKSQAICASTLRVIVQRAVLPDWRSFELVGGDRGDQPPERDSDETITV